MTFPEASPVAVEGVRFAVRRATPARRRRTPPALLLHGVPQTSTVWRGLLPELARDRLVLAPDLKGLGGSEHRLPYDRATLAHELAALLLHELDAAGLSGPVDVVGHDLGGALALGLAGHRPDLVRRLVIVSAPYRKVDLVHSPHVPLFAIPALPELALARVSFPRLAYRKAWRCPRPPDPARVEEDAAAYAGSDRVSGLLAYYRAAVRQRSTPAADVVVERALVIWGADDPVQPLWVGEAVVKDLERAGTDPTQVRMLIAAGAGHFPLEEAADVVLPAIAGFLREA
jgi:haloacetate dehalogenase